MKSTFTLLCALFLYTPLLNSAFTLAQTSSEDLSSISPTSFSASRSYASASSTFLTSTVSTGDATSSTTTSTSSGDATPTTTTTVDVTKTISSTSTTPSPTQTVDPDALREIRLMRTRRISNIIGDANGLRDSIGGAESISAWLASLEANGKWPDNEVDYTTGCEARRANWPAQNHWQRILVMAAAWNGGLQNGDQFVNDENLLAQITLAVDYWFGRDFTNLNCLAGGGKALCPCENPDNSLWNTNWFSNIILIPRFVGQVCLLLNAKLTETQSNHCDNITGRSFDLFEHTFPGVPVLTGANLFDVASIGVSNGLLTLNTTVLADAYRRMHNELAIQQQIKADGIRADGSFGQHSGVLYNGNYGKDFVNAILAVEIEAAGTRFAATLEHQSAFATLIDGDRWMIYRNTLTGVPHWDFSALGRFISFPAIDFQATSSIKINLTAVGELGHIWDDSVLRNFARDLSEGDQNANAGKLLGNRMFYANDYMAHRGRNYVSTVKMFSKRTKNTECLNSQNPLGFHLSDGTHYTYLQGNEYEDIAAAWDWNLIPGTTTDYGATLLSCNQAEVTGREAFVGGVSNGDVGISVMRYTNPLTAALSWQKAWFFLDNDVQYIMLSNITSTTDAPIYSVLDQRRRDGEIFLDDDERPLRTSSSHLRSASLYHGGIGYSFLGLGEGNSLHIDVGEKTGNWSLIGSSTQPPATVDLFAAWIEHDNPSCSVSYSMFPGTTFHGFKQKVHQSRIEEFSNDEKVAAIFDNNHQTAMVVFWDVAGGSVTIKPWKYAPITIDTTGNIALIYRFEESAIVISDPSQTLSTVEVNLSLGPGRKPPHWGPQRYKNFVITLPSNGLAGSSVRQNF